MLAASSLLAFLLSAGGDGGVVPPAPDEVVAVVRKEPIRLSEIDPRASATSTRDLDIRALQVVVGSLIGPWGEERKLQPTAREIDWFLGEMMHSDAGTSSAGDPMAREFAESWVWNRKIQRALHQRYGGKVIWQQFGSESVGAYPQFLLDEERAGHLRFPDARWRSRILDIARDFPGIEIPADSLDEELALKAARQDGGRSGPGRDAGR
jgi:hypothetical protein